MGTVAVPASAAEALEMWQASAGFLADLDAASLPAAALAACLLGIEQADAVTAVARARILAAYDAQDGHLADGQRSVRAWLVHMARVTRGQAAQYKAIQALARDHQPLLAGLRARALTRSVALQLALWTRAISAGFRGQAEEILVAAARAGADLRALAQICAEIRSRTVPPDPDGRDPALDRAPVPRHHPGRRRGHPRRPHPRVRRHGPGRPGRPVRPRGRGPADPAGRPGGPPRRSAPATAAPGWRAMRPAGSPATRSSSPWSPPTSTRARWTS